MLSVSEATLMGFGNKYPCCGFCHYIQISLVKQKIEDYCIELLQRFEMRFSLLTLVMSRLTLPFLMITPVMLRLVQDMDFASHQ